MRLSQLTKLMDRDDEIIVEDYHAPIDKMRLFCGKVKAIRRDDPINKSRIVSVCADNDTILILIEQKETRQ